MSGGASGRSISVLIGGELDEASREFLVTAGGIHGFLSLDGRADSQF